MPNTVDKSECLKTCAHHTVKIRELLGKRRILSYFKKATFYLFKVVITYTDRERIFPISDGDQFDSKETNLKLHT